MNPTSLSATGMSFDDSVLMHPRFQLALVTLFAVVLMFSKLGGNGLANYDDCFYAEKAKEILLSGEWMTMHYAGNPAFENPPFYMWLVALSYKMLGVSEYAAKFPSALMGVATVVLLYFFARSLYGNWAAFCSSAVLSTTFIFVRYARHAMLDVTLAFFFTLAMLTYVLAERKDGRYFLLWGLSIGVCVLDKSILGFFPLAISGMHLVLTRRWKTIASPWFLAGCFLGLALGCSWYVHQSARFGRVFTDAHFGWLIMQRGFTLDPAPWYEHLSYIKDLLTYYWPWLPVLGVALVRIFRKAWRKDETALLLVLWFALVFVVMSLMNARVLWYIMPVFPAAAVMIGELLSVFFHDAGRRGFVRVIAALCVGAMLLINMTPLQVEEQRERDVRVLAPYVKHFASAHASVTAFRFVYHGLNNALLFYSDHAATRFFDTPDELVRAFKEPGLMLCIIRLSDLAQVLNGAGDIHIVRTSDELALIANRPVDAAGVKTW